MTQSAELPIGVFDSGFGGLSVLREIATLLPEEDLIYFGDNAHAPYGIKSEEEIRTVTLQAVQQLLDHGIKALVVACNTATSAAIETIRKSLSIPVIGMEPALKPAIQMHSQGKILVLATAATLRQKKMHLLEERLGNPDYVIPCACPGLVKLVEQGKTSGPELDAYLAKLFEPIRHEDIRIVVLGCTHYTFVRRPIQASFAPAPAIIDGNHGTALNLERQLKRRNLLRPSQTGRKGAIEFITTGDRQIYEPVFHRLLAIPY
jgi:glutamate racemase